MQILTTTTVPEGELPDRYQHETLPPDEEAEGLEGADLEAFKHKRNICLWRNKRRRRNEFVERLRVCCKQLIKENRNLKGEHEKLMRASQRVSHVLAKEGLTARQSDHFLARSHGALEGMSSLRPLQQPIAPGLQGLNGPESSGVTTDALLRASALSAAAEQEQARQQLLSAALLNQQGPPLYAHAAVQHSLGLGRPSARMHHDPLASLPGRSPRRVDPLQEYQQLRELQLQQQVAIARQLEQNRFPGAGPF